MQNKTEKKTRAFICIEFPEMIIKEIARIQEILSKKQFMGKLTELENAHITLKFLGSIDDKTLKKVKNLLSQIKFESLKLKLSRTGIFTYNNNPRIVWIKVLGKVFNLQKQIDNALKDIFRPEERFMSHLTIARIKYARDKSAFTDYIKNIKIKNLKFSINSFKLKSSELKPQGSVYTTIKTFKAGKIQER